MHLHSGLLKRTAWLLAMRLFTVAGAAHVSDIAGLQPEQRLCFPFNCAPRTARGHQNIASVVDGCFQRQRNFTDDEGILPQCSFACPPKSTTL